MQRRKRRQQSGRGPHHLLVAQPRSSVLAHIVPPVVAHAVQGRQAARAPQTVWHSASVAHAKQAVLAWQYPALPVVVAQMPAYPVLVVQSTSSATVQSGS